jgi:hypothetical protein
MEKKRTEKRCMIHENEALKQNEKFSRHRADVEADVDVFVS